MSSGKDPTISLDWLQFSILDLQLKKAHRLATDNSGKYSLGILRTRILEQLIPQVQTPEVRKELEQELKTLHLDQLIILSNNSSVDPDLAKKK